MFRYRSFSVVFIFMIFFLALPSLKAQTGSGNSAFIDTPVPVPANAAQMMANVAQPDISFSGATTESLPLTSLQDGAISVNLNLTNTISGIKVAEIPSWVGSGWALNGVGSVTRSIRGTPDEGGYNILNGAGVPSVGYLSGGLDFGYQADTFKTNFNNFLTICNAVDPLGSCSEPEALLNTSWCQSLHTYYTSAGKQVWRGNLINNLAKGIYDTESDIYFFTAGSYSGSFRFDEAGLPLLTTASDVKIEYGTDLSYFKIITPDGLTYTYGWYSGLGSPSVNGVYSYSYSVPASGSGSPRSHDALKTGWSLLKIEDATSNAQVEFKYKKTLYAEYSPQNNSTEETYTTSPNPSSGSTRIYWKCLDYNLTVYLEPLPTKITSRYEEIELVAGEFRKDLKSFTGDSQPTFSSPVVLQSYHPFLNEIGLSRPYSLGSIMKYSLDKVADTRFLQTQSDLDYTYSQAPIPKKQCGSVLGGTTELEITSNLPDGIGWDRRRLQLQNLKLIDHQYILPERKYQFSYYAGLPSRRSNSFDHWGYAINTASVNIYPDLTKVKWATDYNINLPTVSSHVVDRTADPLLGKSGSLHTMQTPTGLIRTYNLEGHTTTRAINRIGPVQLANISNCNNPGSPSCCATALDIQSSPFQVTVPANSSQSELLKVTQLNLSLSNFGSNGSGCSPQSSFYYRLHLDNQNNPSASLYTEIYIPNVSTNQSLSYNYVLGGGGQGNRLTGTFYPEDGGDPHSDYMFFGNLAPGSYKVRLIRLGGGSGPVEMRAGVSVRTFESFIVDEELFIGGARVSSITEESGSINSVTSFDYSNRNNSDCIHLFSFPTYFTASLGLAEDNPFIPCETFGGPVITLPDGTMVVQTNTSGGFVQHSASAKSSQTVGGSHVGYGVIRKSVEGRGETVYTYETASGGVCADINQHYLYSSQMPLNPQKQFSPVIGKLNHIEKWSETGELEHTLGFEYEVFSPRELSYRITQFRRYPVEPARGNLPWKTFDIKTVQKTSTIQSIETTTDYEYNVSHLPIRKHHLPTKITQSSGGLQTITENTYAYEASLGGAIGQTASVASIMVSKNLIENPIVSRNSGAVVGGTATNYRLHYGLLVPFRTYHFNRTSWRWLNILYYTNSDGLPDIVSSRNVSTNVNLLYHPAGYNLDQLYTSTQGDRTRIFEYDNARRLASTVGIDGTKKEYQYNGFGELYSVISKGLNGTILSSETYSNILQPSQGKVTSVSAIEYPGISDQVSETDYNGFGLPMELRRLNFTSSGGTLVESKSEYADDLTLARSFSSTSGWTDYTYEASPLSRILTVTTSDGVVTSTAYETTASSQTTIVESPDGVKQASVTDGLGRNLKTVSNYGGANPLETTTYYDAFGQVDKITSPMLHETKYTYDSYGRVRTKKIPGQANPTIYNYDSRDRPYYTTLPNGKREYYYYNSFDELTETRIDGVVERKNIFANSSGPLGIKANGKVVEVRSRLQDGTGTYIIEKTLDFDQFGRPVTSKIEMPWGVSDEFTTTYHESGNIESLKQKHINGAIQLEVTDRTDFDNGLRPFRRYQTIVSGASTRQVQLEKNIFNSINQLTKQQLSVNGTMRLQDLDFQYNGMGRLTHINSINENAGAPLVVCPPISPCFDCNVGISELALSTEGFSPQLQNEIQVVDLRLGGGESIDLDYPYSLNDLSTLWADLEKSVQVNDGGESEVKIEAHRSDIGVTVIGPLPLDYVELVDLSTNSRFRLKFNVLDEDLECIRCISGVSKSSPYSLKSFLSEGIHLSALTDRDRLKRENSIENLTSIGAGFPLQVRSGDGLSNSWWRDSLPVTSTHSLHPIMMKARFRPAQILGLSQNSQTTNDQSLGFFQFRFEYEVVNDTGATQRQALNRIVPIVLNYNSLEIVPNRVELDEGLYELEIPVAENWLLHDSDADGPSASEFSRNLAKRLSVALSDAVTDLTGFKFVEPLGAPVLSTIEELVTGTSSTELSMAGLFFGDGVGFPLPDAIPSVMEDAFALEVKYHQEQRITSVSPRYDGLISEVVWQSGKRRPQAYGFNYDAYGRLKEAKHSDRQTSGWHHGNRYRTSYTYDNDGNLKTLKRSGARSPFNPGASAPCYGEIEFLSYRYTAVNGGLQLSNIRDSRSGGTRPSGTSYFSFSPSGEMLSDSKIGLNMSYDKYSMPEEITRPGKSLSMVYDAHGRKWRQEASVNGAVSTQEYYGAIEYRDGFPYSVSNVQGRAVFDDPTKRGVWTYHYNLKDQLGSTRVVLRDRYFDSRDLLQSQGGSSAQYEPTILQIDDYYPFGLRMEDQAAARGEEEQYGYTGQELVDQLDYDLMDYKARWYDPSLGRFGMVDPLADAAPGWTPYRYGFNNPINYIDPDGLFETKAEARRHRRQTKGMGWLKGDRVREQSDGSYALENEKTKSTTFSYTDSDGDKSIVTGSMISPNDLVTLPDAEIPESGYSLAFSKQNSGWDRLLNGPQYINTHYHRDGSESTSRTDVFVGGTVPVGGGAGKGYQYLKTIGRKFLVYQKVVKSKKLGGQARAVYTKVKNPSGKTVRVFKDAFKRDGRHYERANKLPTSTRSRPLK